MSNDGLTEKQKERMAAHMLLTEFVKENAKDVATALEGIISLGNEVSYEGLERNMSVVNQTFATIALKLIDHNSVLDPEDTNIMVLPVGAKTMHSTIEDLSKFIHAIRYLLFYFNERKRNDPAIKMARDAFEEYETQF